MVEYIPADTQVVSKRQSDGSVSLLWESVPVAFGAGRYEIDYGSDPTFSACSSKVLPGNMSEWTIPTELSNPPLFVRVRFVNVISGNAYSSTGMDAGKISFCEKRIVFLPGAEGKGSMFDLYVVPGHVTALPTCAFNCEGAKFVYWKGSDGRCYDDGVLVFDFTDYAQPLFLTAVWSK